MNDEKTILIMDDDPYACAVLEEVVGRLGYLIECACDSAAAIGRLQGRHYDGIILDAWLEHEGGDRVLGWVREQSRSEPIIMMSDTPTDDLWVDVINRGATDLIAKPIQAAQLQRTLRMAVEKKCMTPLPRPATRTIPGT
jgi:DNA-binding NtrC family response regulator